MSFDQSLRGLSAAIALALMAACSSSSTSPSDSDDNSGSEDETPQVDDDGDNKAQTRDAGTKKDGGSTGTGSTKDGGGGSSGAATGVPCEVAKIVESRCGTCHGETPIGAPFSLVSLKDFTQDSPIDDSQTVAEASLAAVTATDARDRMPPASAKQLTDAEKETLSTWLEGGAKAGAACGSTGDGDGDEPGTGGDGDEPGTGTSGGSGGASNKAIEYNDPDLKCYKLTAFATPSNKDSKYSVPTTPDLYTAFNVKAPWSGVQYIKSFRSIIDNAPVLHHWLIFRQLNGGQEGVFPNAIGAHPDGEMLFGWAPGGDNMWFDPDVGMAVPANSVFQLEMHYNNRTGSAKPDASGVELCVTPKKPEHIAGLSWVGTDAIAGTTAVGQCTHSSRNKIRLIASQPHMHTKGTHMKAELTRAGGGKMVIHDEPFDFDFQRAYIHNVDIMPGDRITTTCTYSSPARFGKATSDEMCYFFSIHWPAGQLARQSLGSIIHGPNTCID